MSAKLDNWSELFKYSTELLEDDYNHGQSFVIKTKSVSNDGSTEIGSKFKQGQDNGSGEANVGFESKFKAAVSGSTHEFIVKNSGEVGYDFKTDFLQKYVDVKALQFQLKTETHAIPTNNVPQIRAGFDYNHAKTKFNLLFNLRTHLVEHWLTYHVAADLNAGYNLVFDPKTQNLEKYDFGLTWSPADGAHVGLKHESKNKETLQLGKFFLYFHHHANLAQTVGTEFALDWQKRVLEAKLGFQHKFNDESSAKFKVNHHGFLDAVFKHKLSKTTTVAVTSGLNLKAVVDQKNKSLPFGLQFDFKF